MESQTKIATTGALFCMVTPLLSRVPYGSDWVLQYMPDVSHGIEGVLFLGAFAMLPVAAVFLSATAIKLRNT